MFRLDNLLKKMESIFDEKMFQFTAVVGLHAALDIGGRVEGNQKKIAELLFGASLSFCCLLYTSRCV